MPEKAYLEEKSLGRFLRERLDTEVVANKQIPDLERKFRPDYRSERYKLIIEFDGDQHYQRAKHVIKDIERDAVMKRAGYSIIRIPYFVQLTSSVITKLFGERIADVSPFKNFPHGFIADTVVFPADFCELGVRRFQNDLTRFDCIQHEITHSLADAVKKSKGDWQLVVPPSLEKLIRRSPQP